MLSFCCGHERHRGNDSLPGWIHWISSNFWILLFFLRIWNFVQSSIFPKGIIDTRTLSIHNRKSIDYVRFSMQCSSSQRVRLPFTFLSTHCHSDFREFSMITGMAPDSSLIKIFSRTNWRTLMVWFWEPHPSTSHRTHIRLGLKWHFNFRQRDFENFLDFFRKSFKLESLILVPERGRKLGWLGISHHGNSRIKPQLCYGHSAST